MKQMKGKCVPPAPPHFALSSEGVESVAPGACITNVSQTAATQPKKVLNGLEERRRTLLL